eukprot:jgi/Undpi1/1778/HiC_scaffold_12.g05165.m1
MPSATAARATRATNRPEKCHASQSSKGNVSRQLQEEQEQRLRCRTSQQQPQKQKEQRLQQQRPPQRRPQKQQKQQQPQHQRPMHTHKGVVGASKSAPGAGSPSATQQQRQQRQPMPNAKKGGAAEETARAATTRRGSPTSATAGLSTGSNTSGTTGPSEQYTSPKDEEYVTKGCMYLLLDTVEDLSREMAELKALSMDQAKELNSLRTEHRFLKLKHNRMADRFAEKMDELSKVQKTAELAAENVATAGKILESVAGYAEEINLKVEGCIGDVDLVVDKVAANFDEVERRHAIETASKKNSEDNQELKLNFEAIVQLVAESLVCPSPAPRSASPPNPPPSASPTTSSSSFSLGKNASTTATATTTLITPAMTPPDSPKVRATPSPSSACSDVTLFDTTAAGDRRAGRAISSGDGSTTTEEEG